MTARRTLLHVFSTFNIGGPQIRFAQLVNHFGARYRHRIVAMDGATQTMDRLAPGIEAELVPVPVVKGATLHNLRSFRRLLFELKPDLLVTSNWGTIEWALARFGSQLAHLHMEDGFGPEEAERQLARRVWTRRVALSRSTVLLPSLTLFAVARDIWRLSPRRLVYVPNGVDCARFAAKADQALAEFHGIRRDVPVIGAVGGLRREKNLFRLFDAFALVLAQQPVQLVIVGDGPLRAELKGAADNRAIAGHVVFTGASPVPERLLPLFSAFVLSSDTEQMPLSLLEAMAASRAVASTDVGDVRQMMAEENRPFVVGRDARLLAGAILSLLSDPGKAARIGLANRERAVAVYDQSRMFASYRGLFDGELTYTGDAA